MSVMGDGVVSMQWPRFISLQYVPIPAEENPISIISMEPIAFATYKMLTTIGPL